MPRWLFPVLTPFVFVVVLTLADRIVTEDAMAHDLVECKTYTVFGIRCGWIIGEWICWPTVRRIRYCWQVDHTHEESEDDRDERVLSEMHDCIARLVDEAMGGCDTPEDEEDREACDESEMPRVYQYRNALRRRGTMTAEDPIITSSGSTCSSCDGLLHTEPT